MFSLFITAYAVAAKRIISGWRLEIVLFLGIVLAVALMSSAVIFSNMLAEAALRHTLEQASPEDANFWVRTYSGRDSPPTAVGRLSEHTSRLRFADEQVAEQFQPYMQERGRFLETATFFFQGHSQLELDNQVRPRGRPVIPPMIPIVETWVAALVVGGLAAATLLAFVFVAVAARRLRAPEILRIGE